MNEIYDKAKDFIKEKADIKIKQSVSFLVFLFFLQICVLLLEYLHYMEQSIITYPRSYFNLI